MMSKARFAGILLLTCGLVLTVIGMGLGLPQLMSTKQSLLPQSDSVDEGDKASNGALVINLPAPESVVGSPLLIRGKVYGPGDQVRLRLVGEDQQILVDTLTEVQPQSDKSKSGSFLQTSLVFEAPAATKGWLKAQLMAKEKLLDEETIPLVFR